MNLNHRATAGFWKRYETLPREIQELADKNFQLLKADPYHPSLHFKQIGGVWSARVGRQYRVLALEEAGAIQWFWIGHHTEYDRLLKRFS